MSAFKVLNRREFLSLTGRAGGAMVIGSSLAACAPSSHKNKDTTALKVAASKLGDLGVFVNIQPNGNVEIICHRQEMGQGILTSVPQIIAEELGADWSRVHAVLGNADTKYGNQGTGGSASIRTHITHTRQMGAIAREMLEQAAANLWAVDKSSVNAANHKVTHHQSGRSVGFGEIAEAASRLAVPRVDSVSLKKIEDYTIVGSDVALQGLENIVTGHATYAQDIQIPGMLIASIERPPVVGGKVKSFDATNAMKVTGVVDVVRLKDRAYPVNMQPKSGVAVLALNTWAALEGRKKLQVEWEHGDNASHDSETYKQDLVAKVNAKAKKVRAVGADIYDYEFDPDNTIEATYTVPYHHHMSMETPAATAMIDDNGNCKIWSGTQAPQWGKRLALSELGIDPKTNPDSEKVEFNTTLMGGAFGRKSKNDFTLEALELAKASGKPVKVIWSREDDVKHGFYHSIAANYFKANLNKDNRSDYWLQRLASPPIEWIFDDKASYLNDGALSLGFADTPFNIPNMRFENQEVTTHVRTGWVRSVGNINNAFGLGSFVDELAAKAGISTRQMWLNLFGEDRIFDPRKEGFEGYSHYGQDGKDEYLLDIARFKAVLNEVTDNSGAEETLPDNEGWGISVAYSFNSYAAAATKVKVVDDTVEVLEMHTAIDCGLVITPDRVISQMEGAMIMGLSMALESEITVNEGQIVQNNFYDYPVSRIDKVPPLHVHLIRSNKAPGGVGEPGLPPIMPSITNAIYHASGKRIRNLPVKNTLKV